MSWTEMERAAFAATLRVTDPEAPTLCAGWTVHRLVAHLVLREHRPDLAVRDVRARPGEERQLSRLVSGPQAPPYRELVERFAGGPPSWSPFSWAPDAANLIEYVIHHEDVRRAGAAAEQGGRTPGRSGASSTEAGDGAPAFPRPGGLEHALWKRLGPMARLAYRGSPVGIVQALPGGTRRTVRRGRPTVGLRGEAVELALHALGRGAVAAVEVHGSPEAVRLFEAHMSRP